VIEKLIESEGRIVGFRAVGKITKEDYRRLSEEVAAVVDREGALGLLIDLERFEGESPRAWAADLKFGKDFHREIARMAIVGDRSWERLLAAAADPFYARESRYFHTADREAAWAWLREGVGAEQR